MGNFSHASRLYLSEVMEFESLGPVTSTIIGKVDRTLIVKDITFENGTSLISEMIGRKFARICPVITERLKNIFGPQEAENDEISENDEDSEKASRKSEFEIKQNLSDDENSVKIEEISEENNEKVSEFTEPKGLPNNQCSTLESDLKFSNSEAENKIDETSSQSPVKNSKIVVSNDGSSSSSFEVIGELNTATSNEILTKESLDPVTIESLPLDSELETGEDFPKIENLQINEESVEEIIQSQIGLDQPTKNLLLDTLKIFSTDLSKNELMEKLSELLEEISEKIPEHEFEAKIENPDSPVIVTPHLFTVAKVVKVILVNILVLADNQDRPFFESPIFLSLLLIFCQILQYAVFFLDGNDRKAFVGLIMKIWTIFGSEWTNSQGEEFFKVKVFEELFLTLYEGFYKERNFDHLENDLTLFRKILFTEVIEWQSDAHIRIHVFRCAKEILCQYSYSKPEKIQNLETLASTILIGWIIPVIRYYHKNDFQKMDSLVRVQYF